MTDLAPNLPQVRLSPNALLVTSDQMQQLKAAQQRSKQTSRSSAVAGGLAGGGAVLVAAGSAVLGPIGLLGGALVGWKLASTISGQRSIERARSQIVERLDEIAAALLRDVDGQVSSTVETVRFAVERRRRAFAHDLYQQFEVVQAISEKPDSLEAYRRDALRFVEAFDRCGQRAANAVAAPTGRQPALTG